MPMPLPMSMDIDTVRMPTPPRAIRKPTNQPSGVRLRRTIVEMWSVTVANECPGRSEEHTSELQSLAYLVCRLLLEKKNKTESKIFAAIPKNEKQAVPQMKPCRLLVVRATPGAAANYLSLCSDFQMRYRTHSVPPEL